jgi:putative ABC transport system ATP-binding protein
MTLSEAERSPFIIEIRNVVKDYDFEDYIIRALDNVSLDIKRGEFVVIQGPSGAGKTTLLSIIAGLDSATSGEIIIDGVKTSDFNEDSFAIFRLMNIGFIFQSYNLVSSLTCYENIQFSMQLAGTELEIQKKRVPELLRKIQLIERDDHLPFQLSAGEQQRVGIARALANDPPIIIADEPTANLDKKNSKIIAQLFKQINNDEKTVIVVTHDDNIISKADRLITFEDSKIINDVVPNK